MTLLRKREVEEMMARYDHDPAVSATTGSISRTPTGASCCSLPGSVPAAAEASNNSTLMRSTSC